MTAKPPTQTRTAKAAPTKAAQEKAAARQPKAGEPPERMDPRQKRTREAIIRAGQVLFAEHGPENVSMDDLIRTAEISKQSFYNHFVDKDALARELLHIARGKAEVQVEAANHGEQDPAKRLANGLCVHAANALREPAYSRLILRIGLEDLNIASPANAHIVSDMREGLKRRRLNVMTLEAGTGFTIGVGSVLVSRLLDQPGPEASVTLTQQFVTLTLRAFGLDPVEAEMIASEAAERIVRPAAMP
jgi:AcrR family transcriptional regulator